MKRRTIATTFSSTSAPCWSKNLKDLERRRIVLRTVEPGPPVRVQYALTAKGRAFGEVARAIQSWGQELVAGMPAVEERRTRKAARR